MKLIIVTGKSGSGKSFFADILCKNLNCQKIDLDEISHLSLEDDLIKSKILNIFGKEVFDGEKINRKKLGSVAFNDAKKLEILNSLSLTFIENFVDNAISNCKDEFLILDYALLPEMKYFNLADFKILVVADKNERLTRILNRDKISLAYFNKREEFSLNYDEKKFDVVFDNSAMSKQKVETFVKKLAKKIQI